MAVGSDRTSGPVTVLVTGSSGTVGAAVADRLRGRDATVITAARKGSVIVDSSDARVLDFEDPSTWAEAVAGVDRVFLMRPPPIEDMQHTLIPFIDAALAAGVTQIVFLSLQGVQFNTRTPHHAVEKHLTNIRAPYTFLRPNFFMQNLTATYGAEIRETSQINVPAGRAFTAFIDARDIGAVAAHVLTEPGHLGKAYTLSGEQSLSYFTVAKIMTEELGRPITYTDPSPADYAASLAAKGFPPDYIEVQKMIYKIVRMNISALPNRQVRKLTGTPATTFRTFVQDNRATWMSDPPAT